VYIAFVYIIPEPTLISLFCVYILALVIEPVFKFELINDPAFNVPEPILISLF